MNKLYKYVFIACFSMVYICAVYYSMPISELFYGVACCSISPEYLPVIASPPYIIAIDPGHGGTDTGALAIVPEYQVINTTAAHLYRLLEADSDYIPVYTRTESDPSSDARAHTVNSAGAHLLISIHANSDSARSAHGFECFPTPPGRTHHADSLTLATLIAREMKNAGHTLRGGEEKTGIKYAYYYGDNKKIVDSTDTTVRSRQSFGILEKSNCPAVLVEQCFVTNHSDVATWASPDGCQKAAEIYYSAIEKYFQKNF